MDYYTLGNSGLRVSRLALGTMTFGDDWGWGADASTSRALFDAYVDAGGNFFDTADLYTNGRSEEMLGTFIRERQLRDRAVIATKFSYNADTRQSQRRGQRSQEHSARRRGLPQTARYRLHRSLHPPHLGSPDPG